MRVIDHASAARMLGALMDEARKTHAPIKIVDPGRNTSILMSFEEYQILTMANELALTDKIDLENKSDE